jgi:malate dehydrogenase (oxaloacetate-decarboxylating)
LAGLLNAIKVVGKRIGDIRIAMIGMGAANVATYRLLKKAGVLASRVIACDTKGTLHVGRTDIASTRSEYPDKWQICTETNEDRIVGGIGDALRGADACIAFSQSGPGVIDPHLIKAMAREPIIFACANPIPEIWPWEAQEAGARIVATGRSDFPNQVNNSLVFPGLFRGVLDVRARTISEGMATAAAGALAACAEEHGLRDDRILSDMGDRHVAAQIAATVGTTAQQEGVAGLSVSKTELYQRAYATIEAAQNAAGILLREGVIAAPPPAQ